MGLRCIPDAALKNEFSMVQTCRSINVHVVNTDICWDLHECLMDCIRKQTHQCAEYKLKLFTKHDSRNTKVSIWKKGQFPGFLCCSIREELKTIPLMYQLLANVGLTLMKLRRFQHMGTSQNSISIFFENKIIFFGFHAVVLVKTFPLMYHLLL